jgi:hypothetical protein
VIAQALGVVFSQSERRLLYVGYESEERTLYKGPKRLSA